MKLTESKLREIIRSEYRQSIQESDNFAGWIAIYKGKKIEIKKGEANDLWGAKKIAIKKLNVPKSKVGLLSVEPAVNEVVESRLSFTYYPTAMAKNAKGTNWKLKDYIVGYSQSTYSDTSYIKIVMDRTLGPKVRYFTLSPDMWFRSSVGGSGERTFGLMLRKFKVSGNGKPTDNWNGSVKYPIQISYLPVEFDHPDDDIPTNWETAKGYLLINGTDFSTPTPWGIAAGDVSSFINRMIGSRRYIP